MTSKSMKQRMAAGLKVGMTCRLSGQLSLPNRVTNFHGFDNRDYLLHRHIHWILQLKSPPNCQDGDLSFMNRLKRIRADQMERINRLFSQSAGGMITALIFGDESGLSPDLISSYQTLGIIHLLAVSGMHVVLIFGTLYISLRLGIVKEYLILSLVFCLPLYVVLSGSAPSIVRAGLTASLVLLAALFKKRRLPSTDALGLACCVMILYDPQVLFDLGFQLSFAVTFIILVSGPIITGRYASRITRVVLLSAVSQLASFPIIVVNFYQFSLLSFFLNLLFIPFITMVIMPAVFLGFFAAIICPEIVLSFPMP
ncbi:ComEC/Rec2 family competence protein [Terrilactibacillus sp. S3-3]|nr:ComEC/Rec2 family competence protein [Terrilactibacillus sp. S3-3]